MPWLMAVKHAALVEPLLVLALVPAPRTDLGWAAIVVVALAAAFALARLFEFRHLCLVGLRCRAVGLLVVYFVVLGRRLTRGRSGILP